MVLTERALSHAQETRYCGPLDGATHFGVEGDPGGGPHMEIWLKIEGGIIRSAAYRTHGCPSSRAAGSALCQVVSTGMSVEKAMEITDSDLILILGGLPEGKGHFATMAVNALRGALGEDS